MSSMQWNTYDKLMRGMVVAATDPSNVHDIDTRDCWGKVVEVTSALSQGSTICITCEIWPDTGRIIWILEDRREFARVELKAIAIEKAYYDLRDLPTFEEEYTKLMDQLRHLVRCGYDATDMSMATRVVIRDSDSHDGEVILK